MVFFWTLASFLPAIMVMNAAHKTFNFARLKFVHLLRMSLKMQIAFEDARANETLNRLDVTDAMSDQQMAI